MRGALRSIVARRGGASSRLACLPAILFSGILAFAPADRRMAIEGSVLFAVCLVQAAWPTLLGWAVVLSWFALSTVETIELSLRPGYYGARALLPLALVLLPFVSLLVFRPRLQSGERFVRAFALLVALIGILPLFTVWSP